jgi:hypothetical protein
MDEEAAFLWLCGFFGIALGRAKDRIAYLVAGHGTAAAL